MPGSAFWRTLGCGLWLVVGCTDWAGPLPSDTPAGGTSGMSTPLQPAPMTSTNPVQPSNPGSAPGSMAQPPSNPASMPVPPAAQPVGFDADVHPILVDRCGNCHGADQMDLPQHGAASADASFNALRGMSRGEPVYQRVLARASGTDPMGFMPPPYANCRGPLGTGDCLTEDEFDLTAAWVEQGATRR